MSASLIPAHVAVIMDGNGRWAKQRFLPRAEGHRQGVLTLDRMVESVARRGVKMMTVFAFSSENWHRPEAEVNTLMDLFGRWLRRSIPRLLEGNVRLIVTGDRAGFSPAIQEAIRECETATAGGTRMTLYVAANYGGRWDCAQAAQQCAAAGLAITPENIQRFISTPDVDLLIRTGGESRISNFLLWQSAYAEIYMSPVLWPDFNDEELDRALVWYEGRERRFGRTSEQLGK